MICKEEVLVYRELSHHGVCAQLEADKNLFLLLYLLFYLIEAYMICTEN